MSGRNEVRTPAERPDTSARSFLLESIRLQDAKIASIQLAITSHFNARESFTVGDFEWELANDSLESALERLAIADNKLSRLHDVIGAL